MSTSQPATGRAAGGGADAGPVRRHLGLALVVIATAQLMVVLDATIVNVALPRHRRSLTRHLSHTHTQTGQARRSYRPVTYIHVPTPL